MVAMSVFLRIPFARNLLSTKIVIESLLPGCEPFLGRIDNRDGLAICNLHSGRGCLHYLSRDALKGVDP